MLLKLKDQYLISVSLIYTMTVEHALFSSSTEEYIVQKFRQISELWVVHPELIFEH